MGWDRVGHYDIALSPQVPDSHLRRAATRPGQHQPSDGGGGAQPPVLHPLPGRLPASPAAGAQGGHEEGEEREEELAQVLAQEASLASEAGSPARQFAGGNIRETKHQFYGNNFPLNWPPPRLSKRAS